MPNLTIETALATNPVTIPGVYCLFLIGEAASLSDQKMVLLPVDSEDTGRRYGAGKYEADLTLSLHSELVPLAPHMLTVISGADRHQRGAAKMQQEIWEEAGVAVDLDSLKSLPSDFNTRTLQLRGDKELVIIAGSGYSTQLSGQQMQALEEYVGRTRSNYQPRILTPQEVINSPDVTLRPFAVAVFQLLQHSGAVHV